MVFCFDAGTAQAPDLGQPGYHAESDRMDDDGYPIVVDLGTSTFDPNCCNVRITFSERQSRLARQRLIDEVIQEQAFDQDVIEELERANMRRVFEDIEDAEGEHSAQRRRATANGIVYVLQRFMMFLFLCISMIHDFEKAPLIDSKLRG
ncbi:unnamed protein product [Cylicostephanus goldi]|uniref:Uncharacterized protein n=1 Tax=Cylicostephanus goldi TaxID=71465 RepID=A0A3P6T255_CYLGO|nr:unnamed protein product [Cylicostephanus goldi]